MRVSKIHFRPSMRSALLGVVAQAGCKIWGMGSLFPTNPIFVEAKSRGIPTVAD